MKALCRLSLVLVCCQAACVAAWHRVDLNHPQPLSPTQQIEVWRGDSATRWHVVDVTKDSIIGIPLDQPVTCESCHRAVARAQVDSVRWGDSVSGFVKTLAFTVLVVSSIVTVVALQRAFSHD